jgi:outer membrane receptor protein involved in Fe transport
MLVDGMRLNTAIFRPAPNQYYSLVDAWNVERLEVVRGTASTLYGSDAMGGIVNVVTSLPRLTGADWSLRGTSLGAFRSADLSAIGRLTLEGGRQGMGLRGGLTYEAIDDVRAGGGIGVQRPSGYEVGAGDVSADRCGAAATTIMRCLRSAAAETSRCTWAACTPSRRRSSPCSIAAPPASDSTST